MEASQNLWFMIVIGGFALSAVLWIYLLLQYRGAAAKQRPSLPAKLEPIGRPQPTPIAKPAGISPIRTLPPTPAPSIKPALAPTMNLGAAAAPTPAAKEPTQPPVPAANFGAAPAPAPAPAPAAQSAQARVAADLKTGQTITGGISPAVVYLQNLKNQLEHLDKEVQGLKSQVTDFATKHDGQYGAILGRLGELKDELHNQIVEHHQAPVPAPAAAAPAPEPEPAAAAESPPALNFGRAPEPVVESVIEKPVPMLAPARSKKAAIIEPDAEPEAPKEEPTPIQLSVSEEKPAEKIASAQPEPEPAPAPVAAAAPAVPLGTEPAQPSAAPAAEETQRPRRRGPVWPV